MTQLSTRLQIDDLGEDDVDVVCEYDYHARSGELYIHEVNACIGDARRPVWHLLNQRQRDLLEDRCREDYTDRMDAVTEARGEDKHAW